MCYRQPLRQVRRARRRAKAQQRARLPLKLEGFVALPLPPVTNKLTVPIERAVGTQVAQTLRETLRERRRALKTESAQRRRDGGENAYRQGQPCPEPVPRSPALAMSPPAAATATAPARAPPPAGARAPQSGPARPAAAPGPEPARRAHPA